MKGILYIDIGTVVITTMLLLHRSVSVTKSNTSLAKTSKLKPIKGRHITVASELL